MNQQNTMTESQAISDAFPKPDIPKSNSPRIIAVTSGKGGVGKTNISLNLAIALSRLNKRVCIFDADLGLANINILLGISPEFDIQHVFSGEKEIKDILISAVEGIQIIPGSSGIQQFVNINREQIKRLILGFEPLLQELDYFIIDTSAGISPHVLSFVMAAHESIVVVTKEPTSITDGYALIKVITSMGHTKKVNILVNMVQSPVLVKKIFQKLFDVSKKHLGIELYLLGSITTDQNLTNAVCNQKPVLSLYPSSPSGKTFITLASKISNSAIQSKPVGSKETNIGFWSRALKILNTPFKKPKNKIPPTQTPPARLEITAQPDNKPQSESKPLSENITGIRREPAKMSDKSEKNGFPSLFYKISDKLADNQFSFNDFVSFNHKDKFYIEKLDEFINKYSEFLEVSVIAGKGKYFIELDFDNIDNEKTEK